MERPSNLAELQAILRSHRTFILTTHVNPDGDALGSELALARTLRKLGQSVRILNHSATPENYRWMDPDCELLTFSASDHRSLLLAAEVIIILDTNHPDRLRSLAPSVLESKALKVVIDHHLDPDAFADHYYVDGDATSTGELLFHVIASLPEITLTKDLAVPLYTAIMTDTGSFRYPRTSEKTHRIAAELLRAGVDPSEVFVNVYENWTPGRMRLLGEVLDSMKTASDGKIAYVICTRDMFRNTGTTEVETDSFTVYPMSIRGVRVGILFNELVDGVKISFRSKGTIPINELAKEFGGNGHMNAAGARLFDVRLDDIISQVIGQAEKYVTD